MGEPGGREHTIITRKIHAYNFLLSRQVFDTSSLEWIMHGIWSLILRAYGIFILVHYLIDFLYIGICILN